MKYILNWAIRGILLLIGAWLLMSFLHNDLSIQPQQWLDTSRDKIATFQEKTSNEFEEYLPDPHSIDLPDLPEHTNK